MTHVLEYLTTNRWAMERNVLDRFVGIIERHLNGQKLEGSEIEAIVEKRDRDVEIQDARNDGGVAIIPISGVIAPHARMVNGMSQPRGTSVAAIRKHLRSALGDPTVHTVLFDVESPGGSVQGIDELAAEIHSARSRKRIVAHTDSLMASAAYWIASQANEIYSTRSADVGSIGVYAVIDDYSKRYEQYGVKTHVVSSGGHKGAGVQGTEITSEHLAEFQESVNAINDIFVAAVAAGRQVDAKEVRAAWNNGKTWLGDKAASMRLVDGIATFEGLLARLQKERGQKGSDDEELAARAADNPTGDEMTTKSETEVKLRSSEDLDKARAEGIEAERARITAIKSAAHPSQRDLADELIENGTSAQDAKDRLHADLIARFDAKADEPKAEEPTKAAPLYSAANDPVYGEVEEAVGKRAAKKDGKVNLVSMTREELSSYVDEQWAERADALKAEYMSKDGYHGSLLQEWLRARSGEVI